MTRTIYNLINTSCDGITCTSCKSEYTGKYSFRIYFYITSNPYTKYDVVGFGATESKASDEAYNSMYQKVKRLTL